MQRVINVVGLNIEERIPWGASAFLAYCIDKNPFKFSIIPIGANLRRYSTWEPILKAVKLKLTLSRSKQLSIGGRITLVNWVLSALPLYFFSFFRAPNTVIKEINGMQRQFLWGDSEDQRKMAWVK